MANFYTRAVKDPNLITTPRAINNGAFKRSIMDNFILTTAVVIGDVIFAGKVRSGNILLPTSTMINTAATASLTMSIGFNESGASAVLASALAMSTAGTKSPLGAVTTANLGKTCWELAGLSADPQRDMDIIFTIAGANNAIAANIFYNFEFLTIA